MGVIVWVLDNNEYNEKEVENFRKPSFKKICEPVLDV
jgi:hypothetical protein